MNVARRRKHSPRILASSVAALLGMTVGALGDSATWLDVGNNWTSNANWSAPFPNGSADVATFGAATTFLTPTITSSSITVGEVSFTSAAPTYTVTLNGATGTTSLSFDGAGVTNNSGKPQNLTASAGSSSTATFALNNNATAGSNTVWTLNEGGVMRLADSSTAGNATLTIESGGKVFFSGSASGASSLIKNNSGGVFDISGRSGGVSVGSIEGGGNFFLGSNTLTAGSGNSNTTVSGVIQDGGAAGGTGGGLTKAGTGTLTLTGANTYTGATTLSSGTLALSGGGALSASTAVNITGATGIFSLSGVTATSQSIGSLAGVSGSAVALGNRNLTIGGNNSSTSFAGVISGTGGSITKVGTGTLTLTGANTYTGGTTLNNGQLFLNHNSALGTGGALVIDGTGGPVTVGSNVAGTTIANPVTLRSNVAVATNVDAANPGNQNLTFSGAMTLAGGDWTISGATPSGQVHFSGVIGDGGSGLGVTFVGTSPYVAFLYDQATANTYTGLTTVGNKAFLVLNSTTTNGAVIGNVLVTGTGSVDYFRSEQIADTATVTVNGTGLDATGTHFEGFELRNNTETIDQLLGTGTVGLGSGTLRLNRGSFSGVIQDGDFGTGGDLTKIGAGTLTLTGANTYTGATTVNGGILNIDTGTNANVLNSASGLVLGGGTFRLTGATGAARITTLNGLTIDGGPGVIDVNNTGTSTTLDLRGTSGTMGIVRNGNGSVDFRASTGTLGVNAIVLTGQANNASGMIGVWATVNNGTAFAVNDGTGKIVAFTNYTEINALGPNQILNGPDTNVRINALGTAGPVSIASPATNINTLAQNYTTASTIDTSPGVLRLGVSGGILIASGAAGLTIGTAPNSGKITAGGASSDVAGELTLNNQSASTLAINSAITDNGTGAVSVTKVGSGLAILAGTNTSTGATTIAEGELRLTGSLAGTGAVSLTSSTAIFNLSGIGAASNVETIGSLAGVAGSTVQLGGKELNVGGNNVSTTFAGVITGEGGKLTKTGTGALTLSGNNSYKGGTTLNGGTLFADHNNGVNATNKSFGDGALTINSGTIGTHVLLSDALTNPDLSTAIKTPGGNTSGTTIGNVIEVMGNFSIATNVFAGNEGAQNLTLSGAVDLNGATRTITGVTSQGQIHLTGVISNGGLTLAVGPSISTYVAYLMDGASANAYTGLTTVGNKAFLVLDNNSTNGAILGNVVVESGGSLELYSGNQIADSATITVNSTGMDTLGTHFEGFEMAGQSEAINSLLGNGTVGLGSGTLTLSQGDFGGSIRDGATATGGKLTKTGTGTLTLSGANTYTGATTVTGGTLVLTGAGALADTAALNLSGAASIFNVSGITATSETIGSLAGVAGSSIVLGGKTLTVGGDDTGTTFAGVLSGTGGGLTKTGTGTMVLSGANTYTGATTVNGGTLSITTTTNPAVLSSSSALVVGGATFQLTGTSGETRTQVLSGLTVNAGNNVIDVNNTGISTTLDLRGAGGTAGIKQNVGGFVDFKASAGTFGTNAIVLTNQQNDASGILGAWATVKGGEAFAANDGTGKIVAYTDYDSLDPLGPNVIINDPTSNLQINALGTSGPVGLAATTTNLNTLTQNFTTAATIDTAGKTLRFGAAGGIFILAGKEALTIGTAPNSGTVTAGGNATNVAGELFVGNFSTKTLTIHSAVTNNGTGVVSLTTTGTGLVVLTGTNTYTGATTIGAGTLQLSGAGSLADGSAVNLSSATSKFDISLITAARETIGSLAGSTKSTVTLGAVSLVTGGDGTSTTFGGVISGTGGLTKVGAGTMTLTGANIEFTGTTTVSLGTLSLNTTGGNALAGNVVIDGGGMVLQKAAQIKDTATVSVADGTLNIGVNNETVAGVQLIKGSILGTTGVLTSTTAFDVQSGAVSANLAGSVDLNKTTDGTLTLSGQNSYTGTTNVKGGVLVLEGIINGGQKGVSVTNGSEFDVTLDGIVVVSNGVTAVTGAAGSTINNAGLIQGGNNSTGIAGASDNTITNSGSIVGGAVGFKGVALTGSENEATNAGFIIADKAVVLTNTTGANAVVNYGTLTGNSGTAIDATGSRGNLTVTNVGAINGAVRFGSGDDVMTLVAGVPVNGLIDGGTGNNNLRLVGGGTDLLDLSGSQATNFARLNKLGGGTWTLVGTGTFAGGTTVGGGNLIVRGDLISDVVVQEEGFLSGTGFVTGSVTNFGTMNPSESLGKLTVKGDFTQKTQGTLVIEIAGRNAGEHDVLNVSGQAKLTGTLRLVRVDRAPRLKLGDKITFLNADGGVTGKFEKVSDGFSSDTIIQRTVVYGSHTVSLEGTQGSYAEYAELQNFTPNQRSTARAVDGAAFSGRNEKMVAYLNDRPLQTLPGELDRIAPEELTAVYRLGVGLANVQSQNLQRRMDDLRLSNRRVSTTGFQTSGAAPGYSGPLGAAGTAGPEGASGTPGRSPDQRWGAFLNGMAEWIRIGNTENARGYDVNTGGVTAGVDYKASSNFAVGVSAGYAGTGAKLADGGKLDVNSGKIGAYATYYDGGFYADAAVSGGYNNYETRRSALEGTARGKADGGEFNAMIGAGYDWSLEALTLGALTSIEYSYMGIDEFTERGSLAPLTIAAQHGQSARSKLGFKAAYDWRIGGLVVRPEIRAVWQHEYADRSFELDSRLASGAGGVFSVNDPAVGRDSLLLGAGGSVLWNTRTAAYLFYDGELYRKESESHNISGGVRISF